MTDNTLDEWCEQVAGLRSGDPLLADLRIALLQNDRATQSSNELGFQRLLRRLDSENLLRNAPPPVQKRAKKWSAGLSFAASILVAFVITLQPLPETVIELSQRGVAVNDSAGSAAPMASSDADESADRRAPTASYATEPRPDAAALQNAMVMPKTASPEVQSRYSLEESTPTDAATPHAGVSPLHRKDMPAQCDIANRTATLRLYGTTLVQVVRFYHDIHAIPGLTLVYDRAGFADITYNRAAATALELQLRQQFAVNCVLGNTDRLKLHFELGEPQQ